MSTAIQPNIICELSALAEVHQALNLAEGLPDFAPPEFLVQALASVVKGSSIGHQTFAPQGLGELQQTLLRWLWYRQGLDYQNPDRWDVLITAGATEALYLACRTLIQPHQKVLVFVPAYACYFPLLEACGLQVVCLALPSPDRRSNGNWVQQTIETLSSQERQAIGWVLLNSPNNPDGFTWSEADLNTLAEYCGPHDWNVLSDEVYNHLIYDISDDFASKVAPSPAQHPLLKPRTLVFNSLSKTFSATGWRVGFVAGPQAWIEPLKVLHESTTGGTASLTQKAAVAAFSLVDEESYYRELRQRFSRKRSLLLSGLEALGIHVPCVPQGAYYVWGHLSPEADSSAAEHCLDWLTQQGFAAVPGESFWGAEPDGDISGLDQPTVPRDRWVRFCFAKRDETLQYFLQLAKKIL
jgi:aspartate/methionine/tyrosine aminotransferase